MRLKTVWWLQLLRALWIRIKVLMNRIRIIGFFLLTRSGSATLHILSPPPFPLTWLHDEMHSVYKPKHRKFSPISNRTNQHYTWRLIVVVANWGEDPGRCTSNKGESKKFYSLNILDNFKNLLFCCHTFGVGRSIDVLDSEKKARILIC